MSVRDALTWGPGLMIFIPLGHHQPPRPTVRVSAGVTFGGRVEESSLLDRAVCVS